jgi:hypothetical protein
MVTEQFLREFTKQHNDFEKKINAMSYEDLRILTKNMFVAMMSMDERLTKLEEQGFQNKATY